MKAAFFDLDGCLVDSRAPISAAMNAALDDLGMQTMDPADLHRYIGPPLLESFERILGSLDSDPALAHEAVAAYRRAYPDLALSSTRPVPGIAGLLSQLHGRVTMMVVTSKPVEYAEPILEAVGLRTHFEAVFGPALDALTEPKSAKLEQALAVTEVGKHERRSAAVMVGDRMHDVVAGKRCGTGTIGVTWGIGDRTELTRAGADVVVDHPWQLLPEVVTSQQLRAQ